MNHEFTVLVVDDSPNDLKLVLNVLKAEFKVLAATSGAQALEIVNKAQVDLVVLDVSMPQMSGYEACVQIKHLKPEVEVIFLSANDSTDEILKGYDVGASDYIIKPFSPDVLLTKVKSGLTQHRATLKLQGEADYASEVAITALSSTTELSSVVSFLRASFNVADIPSLQQCFIQCLSDFRLNAVVKIVLDKEQLYCASQGVISNLERELLDRASQMEERLKEVNTRLFLNFKRVSLIVKNMPTDDLDKVGRLKDYLMIVIEGLNEKSESFNTLGNLQLKRTESVNNIIADIKHALTQINSSQKQMEHENVVLLDNLSDAIESLFVGLGLNDQQESQIISLVTQAQSQSASIFNRGIELEQSMNSVMKKIEELKES